MPIWTTQDELRYLETIGEYSESYITKELSRAEMLRLYLKAARLRSDWGMVSREAVILFAETALAELIGK